MSKEMKKVMPTAASVEEEKKLKALEVLRIKSDSQIDDGKATISVDGVKCLEISDIHAIKAKQKQGKTTALKVMCGAWLKGELYHLKSELEKPVILWMDTEQKPSDVKLIINDIKQMTGLKGNYIDKHLFVYQLRKENHKTLLESAILLIKKLLPQIIIIDGIVDFVESFNDEQQSHQLISKLLRICDEYSCAIISVLHENKSEGDRNMRGHLGTMLAQKAGTVLECKKANDTITVGCTDPRHQAMPSWKIKYDENGHIVDADDLQQQKLTTAQLKDQQQLNDIFTAINQNGGSIDRKELTNEMILKWNLNRTTVSNKISARLKSNVICESNGSITITPSLPLS